MKNLVFLMLVFILSACSITKPAMSEYRIASNVKINTLDSNSCKEKSLKVAHAFSSKSLMADSMKYVVAEHKEYAYNESKWAQSPNASITQLLVKTIRDAEIFSSVESFKSRSRSDFILESNIDEFMQYFSKDEKESLVKVSISLSLINSKTGLVMNTKRFTKTIKTKTADANGGVEALNEAVVEIMQSITIWLSKECS